MAEDSFLMPVGHSDIKLGEPLAFPVYDADRNLLLNRGVAVTSRSQLDALIEKGLFRERDREVPPAPRSENLPADDPGPGRSSPAGRPAEETLDLDALKLMPGDSLQLQPLLEGQVERWTVRVIGQLKPRSLLVTAPLVDGRLIFIKDGQTYLVRAFSGLNVCAFKARVLKSQLQPYPYLHLSWPDGVQAMRIRKAMRAPASIITAVHESEDGRQQGAGRIVDISVGGAKVVSSAPLGNKDDSLWLSFKVRLGDMEEYVKTPAVIRTTGEETDEEGKTMKTYGIQFGDLNQSQRLIIMNLVYQFILKEPA